MNFYLVIAFVIMSFSRLSLEDLTSESVEGTSLPNKEIQSHLVSPFRIHQGFLEEFCKNLLKGPTHW